MNTHFLKVTKSYSLRWAHPADWLAPRGRVTHWATWIPERHACTCTIEKTVMVTCGCVSLCDPLRNCTGPLFVIRSFGFLSEKYDSVGPKSFGASSRHIYPRLRLGKIQLIRPSCSELLIWWYFLGSEPWENMNEFAFALTLPIHPLSLSYGIAFRNSFKY